MKDDVGLRSVVAVLLEPFARTDYANTLAEAYERVAKHDYDLVLLDISLSDGSGWDLFDKLRAKGPLPPVIVFSGSSIGQERMAAVEGVLLKAHSTEEQLVATIRHALGNGRHKEQNGGRDGARA